MDFLDKINKCRIIVFEYNNFVKSMYNYEVLLPRKIAKNKIF